jgi:hypothetical protein
MTSFIVTIKILTSKVHKKKTINLHSTFFLISILKLYLGFGNYYCNLSKNKFNSHDLKNTGIRH